MTHGEKKEIIAKEPLWKQVCSFPSVSNFLILIKSRAQMDRRFFWNEHLCREFKSRNVSLLVLHSLQ